MKTSAGIYFKRQMAKGERRRPTNLVYCLLPIAFFLASCTAARFETVPVSVSPEAEEKHSGKVAEKPEEKAASKTGKEKHAGFEKFKGDRKGILASWYGPDFHGRPTSSGELFNMYAFTCAHREYPFGTKLRVVNPKNDKEVECVVNDRGPFIPGRDLDLSYASAKKIDLIGPGTGYVIVEPLGRDLRYVKYIRYGASNGILTIQVGSFKDESNAKRLKAALEMNHKNVYIIESNVGGVTYYRVRIGKFNNKAEAAKIGNDLANEGYNVMVTKFEQRI